MKEAGIEPDEVSYTTLMNKVTDFEGGRKVLDEMKEAGIEPNEVTYTSLFSKKIGDVPANDILDWYFQERHHPSRAIEPLIKNLFKKNNFKEAFFLILQYPYLGCSKKIMRKNFEQSMKYFNMFQGTSFYINNIDYTTGIAFYIMGKLEVSKRCLERAMSFSFTPEREKDISKMLNVINRKLNSKVN
jgi:pentatricopeptide repeat protein